MAPSSHRIARALAAMLGACALWQGSAWAGDVASADLEAAVRTLEFVDSMHHHSPILAMVVYNRADAASKASAQRIAAALSALSGPDGAAISASAAAANEFGQGAHRVDFLYCLPGISGADRDVIEYIRRLHVLSISNDPACLNAQSCTLLVQAGQRTNIVLNTATARESNVAFSSVFAMMVKRQ